MLQFIILAVLAFWGLQILLACFGAIMCLTNRAETPSKPILKESDLTRKIRNAIKPERV